MALLPNNKITTNSTLKQPVSRRDFLKVLKYVSLNVGLFGVGGMAYATWLEPAEIEVKPVRLVLPHMAKSFSGLRMVQISDLHFGGWMNTERLQKAVDLIMAQVPDLVVITGDLVISYDWQEVLDKLGDLEAILIALVRKFPVFAVMGNHDHWGDVNVVRSIYQKTGVHELCNDVFPLEKGGEKLYLAGVDDVREQYDRLDLVLERLPATEFAILLAHEPDFALESAATGRFVLQLSGHSHGGQVVLPFVGAPILPSLGRRFPSGLYNVNGMFQYTNRGLGMTPPLIRFNCPPEITVLTLESA